MPVELRKRKAPAAPPPAPAPKRKTAPKASKPAAAPKAKEAPAAPSAKPAVGDVITVDGFGGDIETHDGAKTSLKALLDESKAGVVLFTYPKASTPGCTTQVCLFRDSYDTLTDAGLAVFGLSADSGKANTTFKTKQNLPYTLLCDPSRELIDAIGLKPAGAAKTTRGVFVVDKQGKVLAAQPGGPAATLDVVKRVVEEMGEAAPVTNGVAKEDKKEEEEEKEDEKKEEEEKKDDDKPAEEKEGEEKKE